MRRQQVRGVPHGRPGPVAALSIALGAFLATGCAGNPAPGEPGYPYNVEGEYEAAITANDGVTYVGTVQLATSAGGAVEGEMLLDDPMAISGSIEGTLAEDQLQLAIAFEIAEIGCVGVVSGSGTVAEGGTPVEGTAEIQADCEAPTEASFRFTR